MNKTPDKEFVRIKNEASYLINSLNTGEMVVPYNDASMLPIGFKRHAKLILTWSEANVTISWALAIGVGGARPNAGGNNQYLWKSKSRGNNSFQADNTRTRMFISVSDEDFIILQEYVSAWKVLGLLQNAPPDRAHQPAPNSQANTIDIHGRLLVTEREGKNIMLFTELNPYELV